MSGHDDKSGGSDTSSTDEAAAAATTTAATRTPAANYMPGQLEAISSQLGAGYGSSTNQSDILAWLQSIYPSPEEQAAQLAAQQAAATATTSTSSDKQASTKSMLDMLAAGLLPAGYEGK
jgi:hypothetical protein